MTDTAPRIATPTQPLSDHLFAGPSEMHARGRACDWSATALGPVATWPPALRAAVRLMHDAPTTMAVYAGPQHVTLYNDAYRSVLGAKHPAAFGRPAAEVWAELWPTVAPQFRLILEEGQTLQLYDTPYTIARTVDGTPETAWFDYALSPVREGGTDDKPRNVVAIFNILTETTARVQAEHAIAFERQLLRSLIELMPAPVALHTGPEHRFEIVSESFRRIAGGRDLLGMTPLEAYPELAGQGVLERFDEVRTTGTPWVEHELPARIDRRGTGIEDTWFDIRYEPVRDVTGDIVGVLNFSFDITEQVCARRAVEGLLAESEAARAHSEAVLASVGDPFVLLDREWRITHVNDAAEPPLKTTRDTLLGRTLWEAFPGLEGSVFEPACRDAMALGHVTGEEAYFAPLETWFDVRIYPWTGGLMVHFRDVSARKAAEAEREQLLAAAESARADAVAANRGKGEFLAIMSHELRTPLNAIDGYAELMELGIRGPVTDEQRHDLARIRRSQKLLLGLINNVLNYARVEAGAVHYDVEAVVVEEVLTTCEALTVPQVRHKRLTLRRQPCDPTFHVRADREKLQQVVLNVLSNAIKFTEAGGQIDLRCALARDAQGALVHIIVSDTGIGIAPHQLTRVFEPFVQINTELTRTQHGTGLGLAISRDLARGMGGELAVASTLGEGSTFTLTLRADN